MHAHCALCGKKKPVVMCKACMRVKYCSKAEMDEGMSFATIGLETPRLPLEPPRALWQVPSRTLSDYLAPSRILSHPLVL